MITNIINQPVFIKVFVINFARIFSKARFSKPIELKENFGTNIVRSDSSH